jgi:lipid II:glycine glycyltransferase (peptidoglycan interpeptide bridge formation enzyme)
LGKDPFLILINRGVARLFISSLDDRPLSARLCSSYKGRVYCISGGHAHEGLKRNSGTLLHWELIKKFKEEGAREYNLGGCKYESQDEKSPEHGVYVYKKHFGAECRECASGTKVLRPISYSLVKTLARIVE